MNADGSEVRRLTENKGYDGEAFFSPDGEEIVWRRFSEDGATAEIRVMTSDGEQRQITHLGVMSWAPYFHPSGEYLIFSNNLHGFGNFELFLVDVEGKAEPVRVTFKEGASTACRSSVPTAINWCGPAREPTAGSPICLPLNGTIRRRKGF